MSDKRIVRAAAVQIAPDFERSGGTLEKVCEAIEKAAREGVQLIVFPETFVPYYPYFSFVRPPVASGADHMKLYEEAVIVPGPVTQAVAERARLHRMVVVLGVARDVRGNVPLALEPARHPVFHLLLERAVHGRAADRRVRRADPLVQLLRRQRALRRRQRFRDDDALLGPTAAAGGEARRDGRCGAHARQHRRAPRYLTLILI